jgi:lysozyme family protein
MINIELLIDQLIQREGGYVNNPNDKGGETNYGITIAEARAYGYAGPMVSLPKSTAFTIYKNEYWLVPGFDKVEQTMHALAGELFDTGVNMGPTTASKFLQRALNVLNRQASDFPDLIVDGRLGKLSFYALGILQQKRGPNAEKVLLRLMNAQQAVKYMEIDEANPSQEQFMFGWVLNRVGDFT